VTGKKKRSWRTESPDEKERAGGSWEKRTGAPHVLGKIEPGSGGGDVEKEKKRVKKQSGEHQGRAIFGKGKGRRGRVTS